MIAGDDRGCEGGGVVLGFLFQAEDGIRDRLGTGVQTCALPISAGIRGTGAGRDLGRTLREQPRAELTPDTCRVTARSEERRVGKVCRSRWSPSH